MSSMSKLTANEEESREPNEGLHGVVQGQKRKEGEEGIGEDLDQPQRRLLS